MSPLMTCYGVTYLLNILILDLQVREKVLPDVGLMSILEVVTYLGFV